MKKGLLSWIVLLLATGALVKLHLDFTPDLPARIASHFDMAGRANGWRTKDVFGLGTLPIHLGTAVFIVGLISFMHRLPPHVINVPNPEYWRQPANFQIACEYLRGWSRWFAASELIWATFFDHQLFLANQRQPPYLDSQATNILLAVAILGSPILIAALLIRFSRMPPDQKNPSVN
jgi:uncharacterized membrane protein